MTQRRILYMIECSWTNFFKPHRMFCKVSSNHPTGSFFPGTQFLLKNPLNQFITNSTILMPQHYYQRLLIITRTPPTINIFTPNLSISSSFPDYLGNMWYTHPTLFLFLYCNSHKLETLLFTPWRRETTNNSENGATYALSWTAPLFPACNECFISPLELCIHFIKLFNYYRVDYHKSLLPRGGVYPRPPTVQAWVYYAVRLIN